MSHSLGTCLSLCGGNIVAMTKAMYDNDHPTGYMSIAGDVMDRENPNVVQCHSSFIQLVLEKCILE